MDIWLLSHISNLCLRYLKWHICHLSSKQFSSLIEVLWWKECDHHWQSQLHFLQMLLLMRQVQFRAFKRGLFHNWDLGDSEFGLLCLAFVWLEQLFQWFRLSSSSPTGGANLVGGGAELHSPCSGWRMSVVGICISSSSVIFWERSRFPKSQLSSFECWLNDT